MRQSLAAFVVGCLTVASASADCNRPRSATTALSGATLVFRGIVRDLKTIENRGSQNITPRGVQSQAPWTGLVVTFEVSSVWKGSIETRLTLHITAMGEDDAYTSLKKGGEYIVFASVNPPMKSERFGVRGVTYGAHGCGGTGPVSLSALYLRELGPGRPPS